MWIQQTALAVNDSISSLQKPHQITVANDNQLTARSLCFWTKTQYCALGPRAHCNHENLILNTINHSARSQPAKTNTRLNMDQLLGQPMLTTSRCFSHFQNQSN